MYFCICLIFIQLQYNLCEVKECIFFDIMCLVNIHKLMNQLIEGIQTKYIIDLDLSLESAPFPYVVLLTQF